MIRLNNDIDWNNIDWNNSVVIIGVMVLFLVSVRLMVGVV